MSIKKISIVIFIAAALVLLYGVVDVSGHAAGQRSGYVAAMRVLDAACADGMVLDDLSCDKAALAVYATYAYPAAGLAQALSSVGVTGEAGTGTALTLAQRRAVRAAKRAARVRQVATPAASDIAAEPSVTEQVAPAAPAEQALSAADRRIADRVAAAQALPADYCSAKGTLSGDCAADFNCAISQTTYKCDFKATTAGLRAIAADRVTQSIPCLVPEITDRLGVAAFVEGTQSSICANPTTGRFVYLSMPNDVRALAELLFGVDSVLKGYAKSAGASALTVTSAATVPSCMSVNAGKSMGDRMVMPPDCTMDYGMTMPSYR